MDIKIYCQNGKITLLSRVYKNNLGVNNVDKPKYKYFNLIGGEGGGGGLWFERG